MTHHQYFFICSSTTHQNEFLESVSTLLDFHFAVFKRSFLAECDERIETIIKSKFESLCVEKKMVVGHDTPAAGEDQDVHYGKNTVDLADLVF